MIEEFSLNAWPALQQLNLDGWLLRFADGFSRRSNCVHTLYSAGQRNPRQKIALCEGIYEARDLPSIFRICPASLPPVLDEILHSRGYRIEGETAVLVRELGPSQSVESAHPGFDLSAGPPDAEVNLSEQLDEDAWLMPAARVRERSGESVAAFRRILANIVTRTCYVLLRSGDRPAACGLGVLQQNWVGIYELAVARRFRGAGFARKTLRLVEDWARAYGTTRAYLSCETDNETALRLYAAAGYTELYRYWYRARPLAGRSAR
jgi:GNAT superfamily N-acetyltransferase